MVGVDMRDCGHLFSVTIRLNYYHSWVSPFTVFPVSLCLLCDPLETCIVIYACTDAWTDTVNTSWLLRTPAMPAPEVEVQWVWNTNNFTGTKRFGYISRGLWNRGGACTYGPDCWEVYTYLPTLCIGPGICTSVPNVYMFQRVNQRPFLPGLVWWRRHY